MRECPDCGYRPPSIFKRLVEWFRGLWRKIRWVCLSEEKRKKEMEFAIMAESSLSDQLLRAFSDTPPPWVNIREMKDED